MRRYLIISAAATATLLGGLAAPATAQSLSEQVESLEVAAEQPSGYDRDALNVNYDRDAVLTRNSDAFGDCDGYYSRYDATCHSSEDDVQIDHRVALKEAWDSGLRGDSAWEDFDGDASNLVVMTASLNQSKSAQDIAEWGPPHDPSVCHYTKAYVATKAKYGLTVDETEKAALVEIASRCGNGNDGGGDDTGGNGGDQGNGQPSGEQDQTSVVPEGGVDTGDGSTAGAPIGVLAAGLLTLCVLTLGGLRLMRGRS